ncbi:MAG: phosphatase PAP2 family protein [Desulfomonile tiedjei]|nr:phosphatase PAP2 family protein [Desulfomonile tiedjei]
MSSTSDPRVKTGYSSVLVPTVATVVLCLAFFPVKAFNISLFLWLNGMHSPYSDIAWLGFTTLGDGYLLAIILGAFLLVNPRVTCLGLCLLILSSLVMHAIKWGFPLPRPAGVLESVHVVGPLLRAGTFPSGHTVASFSVGLALAHFCSSRMAAVGIVALAMLVSLSRVFVGAHFPLDVLGGIICSLVVYVLVLLLVWPGVEPLVPSRPVFSAKLFRVALYAEVLAAVMALIVYAWFSAELPPVAATVAVAVLAFLWIRYRKLEAAGQV